MLASNSVRIASQNGLGAQCEVDVSVSYARVDNVTADPDPNQGWVSQFHRHLDVALSKKVGRLDTIKIWRETRELQGNRLFDRTMEDAIRGSAIFLALTSNAYLKSDHCKRELSRFYEKAGKDAVGLGAGDDYRIFKVLLNNIPPSKWPAEYARTTGGSDEGNDKVGQALPPAK